MPNLMFENILSSLQNLYFHNNLCCEGIQPEKEHLSYGAYCFTLNKKKVKFRVAKLTPTKPGSFVTLWKRNNLRISVPHDVSDSFDLYIIHVINKNRHGQFIFTKQLLADKNILSIENEGGKRGFRLYPPWGQKLNKQATQTQSWQLQYYVDISDETTVIPKKLLDHS
jgi:hypothetical protein